MQWVRNFTLAAGLAVFVCFANAQIPMLPDTGASKTDAVEKVPDFDVASVKPHKADDNMMRVQMTQDGMAFTNLTLKGLIQFAYGLRPDQISGGPAWAGTTSFDVDAKVAEADLPTLKKLSGKQRNSMLARLLEERFHLKVHAETKEMQVYELVVAKGGAKLTPSAPAPAPAPDAKPGSIPKGSPMMRMGPGEFSGQNLPMTSIAGELSNTLKRDVIDKTGLTGKYDVDLKWTGDTLKAGGSDNGTTETAPDIFTAVQEQLGLKLQSAKGPVQTLVIDHAELPEEN